GEPAIRILHVPLPRALEYLRVAVGVGGSRPWYEAEQLAARWPRIELEGRFLANDRHLHVDRRAPALLGLLRVLVPAGLLLEDRAQVLDVAGPRRRAAGQQHENRCTRHGEQYAPRSQCPRRAGCYL